MNDVLDRLNERLAGIRKSCGEICETREGRERSRRRGVWSEELEKEVDCKAIFSNPDIDAMSEYPKPPKRVRINSSSSSSSSRNNNDSSNNNSSNNNSSISNNNNRSSSSGCRINSSSRKNKKNYS